MNYLLFIAFILFSISSAAQDCSKESLPQKPGTWKAGVKGSEGGTTADLAKEKR